MPNPQPPEIVHRPFDLYKLRAFVAVARELSYYRAAATFPLSPSSLAGHVKDLEAALGVKLLQRAGKRLVLTAPGDALLDYAGKFERLVAETYDALAAVGEGRQGSVHLLADTAVGSFILPPALGRFRELHPLLDVVLGIHNRRQVEEELLAGRADLAVMGRVPEDDVLTAQAFLPNNLIVVAPANHPLVGKAPRLSDIAAETFLVREVGSGTRATVERFFASHHFEPRIGMQLGDIEAIKQLVMGGHGLSVLPEMAVRAEIAAGLLAPLSVEGFPIRRRWFVVHPRGRQLSPAAEALRQFLLDWASTASEGVMPENTWTSEGAQPVTPA
ncbi:MAG: LysR family transcriptional regulator [Chloroflexota bacterium]